MSKFTPYQKEIMQELLSEEIGTLSWLLGVNNDMPVDDEERIEMEERLELLHEIQQSDPLT